MKLAIAWAAVAGIALAIPAANADETRVGVGVGPVGAGVTVGEHRDRDRTTVIKEREPAEHTTVIKKERDEPREKTIIKEHDYFEYLPVSRATALAARTKKPRDLTGLFCVCRDFQRLRRSLGKSLTFFSLGPSLPSRPVRSRSKVQQRCNT
jgi:hypothetical protein